MKQFALDVKVHPSLGFEHFVNGPNAQCVQALMDWIGGFRSPGWVNCFYLWGEKGSGKTHLLNASLQRASAMGMTAHAFDASQPNVFAPDWDLMVIDDASLLTQASQATCFNWFVNATLPSDGLQRAILVAGDLPPSDLVLREDLRTRMASGLVYGLALLDDAQRKQVLMEQASLRGLLLKADVLDFIMSRFGRDLTSLVSLLDVLDEFSLQAKRHITIPLIKDMLEQL
jgi:DnaA family protein